jgi:hypothetical protein
VLFHIGCSFFWRPFMAKVGFEVVLVPDLFGNRCCSECHGFGWVYSYDDAGQYSRPDCTECLGNGWLREETVIVPLEGDLTFRSKELTKDSYGRYVHAGCLGGLRFFTRRFVHHWSCTSCKRSGVLSATEWELAQAKQPPLNLLANAKGAEKLRALCST